MPAASDRGPARAVSPPDLPHTWRPLGVRIAVWVLGLMLLALVVAVWIGLGAEVRDTFTIFQRGTLIFLALLLAAAWGSLLRSRVTATDEGLIVVNGYRTRTYEWSQVVGVGLGRGAPWGSADLSDGTTISMFGVQGSDGERAHKAIREIRATVAVHTPGRT